MSERDAKVRLELSAGGFLSALKEIEKQAGGLAKEVEGIGHAGEKAEKKLSPMLGSLKKGAGAARDSLAELGSSLKSTLASAATLGGALSFGAGAHAGMELVSTYKDLAFQISNGTGKAVQWTEVQKDIEGAADRWKRSNEEVAASYRALFDETGDLQFTADAVDAVAMAATASGKSVASLTAIAGTLNEKFGIAGNEMEDALASVLQLGSKGGVTVEDLGEKLGVVGASAKQMGFAGKAGLQQVLGMLNAGDDVTGGLKKNLAAVTGLMETFGNADKLKSIEKDLGIKLTDKGGGARKDALDKILSKSGGKEEILSKVFAGDTLKLVSEYGRSFQKVFSETEGTTKKKTTAALDAFHRALEDAGKTTLAAADLEKQAKQRLNDPARQLDEAMNTFKRAFTKPEVIASMEKLATLLPKLASGMASLVEFAVDHPVLAGAGLVGGKVGGAVAGSVAGDIAGALGGAAKSKAGEVGGAIAKAAAANPGWAAAGQALAVAAAAYAGWKVGEAIVDSRMEDKNKLQNDVITGGVEAHAAALSGDTGRMGAARDSLKDRIRQMEKDQGGIGGAFDTFMGGVVTMMPGGDPNFVAPEQKQLMTAKRDLKELDLALAKGAKGGDKAGQSLEKMAQGVDRVVGVLNKIQTGGGGNNNGLPPAPGNQSGSAPR